jgi:hypothetical protein
MEIQTAPKLLASRVIPDANLNLAGFRVESAGLKNAIIALSDDVLYSEETEYSVQGVTPVKKFEMLIPGGYQEVGLRISFDLKSSRDMYGAHAQIYKNDVAFGTLQESGLTYTTFSEDLNFKSGDTLSIFLNGFLYGSGYLNLGYLKNVTICGTEFVTVGLEGQAWNPV